MKLEVILSCMNQTDTNIVSKSNIKSDVVIINQCYNNGYYEDNLDGKRVRMFSTTDRGLSRSRNLALKNAIGDICLVTDDDEFFLPGYEEKIINAFLNIPTADVIAFQIDRLNGYKKKYPNKIKKLTFWDCLKVASVEIAFRRERILEKQIIFDETIGSGVSTAGGEENVFLHNCLKNNLSIYFVPETIAQLKPSESQWISNLFSEQYFIDRGKFTKKLMYGKTFAIIYALYFALTKWHRYKHKASFLKAFHCMLKGIFE